MRGYLFCAVLCINAPVLSQGRAGVFFPTDERLETLFLELTQHLRTTREAVLHDRVGALLSVLLSRRPTSPVGRSAHYAAEPWHVLGSLWSKLPEGVKADARLRILQAARTQLAHGDTTLRERIFFAVDDPALRAELGPPVAWELLEKGELALAHRALGLLAKSSSSSELPPVLLGMEAAVCAASPETLPAPERELTGSLDPDLARVESRIRAEGKAEIRPTARQGPWKVRVPRLRLGSIRARFPLPQHVLSFDPAGTQTACHIPVAVGNCVYTTNGSEVLACDGLRGSLLWRYSLGPLRYEPRNAVLFVAADPFGIYVSRSDKVLRVEASDGTLTWCRYFDASENGELILKDRQPPKPIAVHVTAPLVVDDRVLLGVVQPKAGRTTASLLCLEGTSGRLLWRQKVGSAETRDFLRLGSSPLPLAVWAQRVYFCPNIGFIACCDVSDGAVLFLRTYPRLEVLSAYWSIRRTSRWRFNPPFLWQRLLVVAPQDSDDLLFFDPWNGALRYALARNGAWWVLEGQGRSLFAVGRTLRRIDFSAGGPTHAMYEEELPGTPAGRGQVVGSQVAVPLRDRLLLFDALSGKVAATYVWETQPGGGNMVAAPWGVAVAHRRGLDVYRPLSDDLAALTDSGLAPTLRRLQRAHIALKTGDFPTAFRELEQYVHKAPRYVPAEERHMRLGVANLLGAWLELPLAPERQLTLTRFRVHEYFLASDRDAVEALLAQASYHDSTGDLQNALASYFQSLKRAYVAQRRGEGTVLALRWSLSADAVPFITAKIGDLLAHAPGAEVLLSPWEKKAREELRRCERSPNVASFKEIMHCFPYTEAGQKAYLACARFYIANQNSKAAGDVLQAYLRRYPEGKFFPEAAMLLLEILAAGGRITQTERLCRLLEERFPHREVIWRGQKVQVGPWARERRRRAASRRDIPADSDLRTPVELAWCTRTDLLDRSGSLRLLVIDGDRAGKYLLVRGGRFLRLYDARQGLLLGAVKAPAYASHAGLLVGNGRSRIVVVGRTEALLWDPKAEKKAVLRLPIGKEKDPGTYVVDVHFSGDWFTCLAGNTLRRFTLQGTVLWERALPERGRGPLVEGDGRLYVFAASKPAVFAVDSHSGALSDTIEVPGQIGRFSVPPVPLPENQAVLVAGRDVRVVDLAKRRILWTYRSDRMLPRACRYLPQHADRIYLWGWSRTGNRFVALERRSGQEVFSGFFSAPEAIIDIVPAGADLVALCGEVSRTLLRFTPEGHRVVKQWRRSLWRSFDCTAPLFVTSWSAFCGDRETNRLVAVSLRTGTVLEEGLAAVRRFLGGRLLRDYLLKKDTLFVLTENGLGAFRFADPYRPEPSLGSLLVAAVGSRPAPQAAADPAYRLATLLLAKNQEETALRVLDRLLWERWPESEGSRDLWFCLGAAQEAVARRVPMIIHCRPAPPDITVDGYLEEAWPLRGAVHLQSPRFVFPVQSLQHLVPPWEGPEDASAHFFCAWNRRYFYFGLDVQDDVVLPHDPEGERWLGDCLIIDVDPHGDGGLFPGMDDQMLTLYLTVRQGQRGAEEKPEGLFKARVKDDRSGMIYEVALPWKSLGFDQKDRKVEPGAAFGFNVVLTDDDSGSGAKQALSLNAGHLLGWRRNRAWEAYTPDFFPKIVLEEHTGR